MGAEMRLVFIIGVVSHGALHWASRQVCWVCEHIISQHNELATDSRVFF